MVYNDRFRATAGSRRAIWPWQEVDNRLKVVGPVAQSGDSVGATVQVVFYGIVARQG